MSIDIDRLLDNLACASQERRFLEGGSLRELVLLNVVQPLLAQHAQHEPGDGELRRALSVRMNVIQARNRVYMSFATDADATACYEAITATPKGATP